MKLNKSILVLISLLLSLNLLAADDEPASCKSANTTRQLEVCAIDSLSLFETKLKAIYDNLKSEFISNTAALEALEKSNNDWNTYRDSQCNFLTIDSEGGSSHSMNLNFCKTNLTKTRIKELTEFISVRSSM